MHNSCYTEFGTPWPVGFFGLDSFRGSGALHGTSTGTVIGEVTPYRSCSSTGNRAWKGDCTGRVSLEKGMATYSTVQVLLYG